MTHQELLEDIRMSHNMATLDAAVTARDQTQNGETDAERRALDAELDTAMVRIGRR